MPKHSVRYVWPAQDSATLIKDCQSNKTARQVIDTQMTPARLWSGARDTRAVPER